MICAIDCETEGLDCTKFVCGCLITERCPNKPEIYYDKKLLWNRVIELGISEYNRGKTLCVYSHKADYDFYSYAELDNKNLKWFCTKPFIVAYIYNHKEIIKFLDSMSLYPMSLQKVGELINLEKLEMPEELKNKNIEKLDKNELEKYIVRDTEICLHSITKLRDKLKNEGINIKRLYTINQIAIHHLINEWRKDQNIDPNNDFLFWNRNKGELLRTWRESDIHSAYRGGRVNVWKTGETENVSYIDCNSLYPYSACNIQFPDLRTEWLTVEPLEKWSLMDLLGTIGISKCLIENTSDELGYLPIRTLEDSYYPKVDKLLIGIWTNYELLEAVKLGYKVHAVEWTITWEKAPINPFVKVYEKLYKLRFTETDFDKDFYKKMMNCSIGKLAQTRHTGSEFIIDSVEKAEEYLKQNYEIMLGLDLNYIYSKDTPNIKKKFYAPILPTLITAYARDYHYKQLKKIKIQDLIYCDTDSIIFKNNKKEKYLDKFNISNKMGDFKIVYPNTNITVFGRKTYICNNEVKVSGIGNKTASQEDINNKLIKSKKMITIKTANNIKDVGKFKDETRDLNVQLNNYHECQKLLESQSLFIDSKIENINYFIKHMERKKAYFKKYIERFK